MPHAPIEKLRRLQTEAQELLDEKGITLEKELQAPRIRRFLHFWVMVGNSFVRNRCPVRAAALSYTTLLALVPLIAVIVSVTVGILKQEEAQIHDWIQTSIDKLAPQLNLVSKAVSEDEADAREEVAKRIVSYVENFRSGTLGATAIVALIFVAISLLSTIEAAFNDMWGVASGRRWLNRVVQYWAALTLGPMLFLVAVASANLKQAERARLFLEQLPFVNLLATHLVPLVVLTITFGLLYLLMPNTKVHWRAALMGGIVAAFLLHLNGQLSSIYMSKVVMYSKIYGSLGLIPILLLGIYFSWIIALLGAQVAYAWQNRRAYLLEKQVESINQQSREFVALRLLTVIAQRFQSGERPPSALELSQSLAVPNKLVCQLMGAFIESRLVVEVAGAETGYAPARPLSAITAHDILEALRTGRGQPLHTADDASRQIVLAGFESIRSAERHAAASISLEKLVEEVGRGGRVRVESARAGTEA